MKIDIESKNTELTTPLYNYILEKIGSLEHFIKKWEAEGVVWARVEIGRSTKHHHKGPVYYAMVNLSLPGKLLRAEQSNWDIRVAIDGVRDELQREIKKYKERTQPTESKRLKRESRKLRGKD